MAGAMGPTLLALQWGRGTAWAQGPWDLCLPVPPLAHPTGQLLGGAGLELQPRGSGPQIKASAPGSSCAALTPEDSGPDGTHTWQRLWAQLATGGA